MLEEALLPSDASPFSQWQTGVEMRVVIIICSLPLQRPVEQVAPNHKHTFVCYSLMWEPSMTSEFYTLVSMFVSGPFQSSVDSRKRRISCGLSLLRVALPVCKRWRLHGQKGGGRGVCSLAFFLPYSLGFAFSCDRGREGATQTDALCLAMHNA